MIFIKGEITLKIDIIISADYIREDIIKDKIVVVIDMLRATSVITTAFMNGCTELVPLLTIDEAFKLKETESTKNYLLGGERKAVKIEGFDFSNSPLEYTREAVSGRNVILSTTNGTRALTSCKAADRVLIGAMINGHAVAEKLKELNKDVVIVNAGTNGQFSMDDFICSGYIIKELLEMDAHLDLTDISKTALTVYDSHPDITSFIKNARHYNVMSNLELIEDIIYCSKKNICKLVPEYVNGKIKEYC